MSRSTGPVIFSIVIPLYQKGPYVQRALDSVLVQTHSDWELIVIDDGSTDDGPDIVAKCADPRVRLIRQPNSGPGAARNRGIREAQYPWIAFLDADDWWNPGFLAKQAQLIQQFPGAAMYATAYDRVYPNGSVRSIQFKGLPPHPWEGVLADFFLVSRMGSQPVCSSAVVVSREALDEVGGFPVDLPTGQDRACWNLVALNHSVVFSTWVGASYLQDAANNRHTRRAKDIVPLVTEVARKRGQVRPEMVRSVKIHDQRARIFSARKEARKGAWARTWKHLSFVGWPSDGEILLGVIGTLTALLSPLRVAKRSFQWLRSVGKNR